MATHLSLSTTLNRPYINSAQFEEEPIYALLELHPVIESVSTQRTPLNLVLIVDSSGTMYNFQLSNDEREYWMGLALSRDEMERGEADNQEAVFWSGQTLLDMQSIVRKPISLAIDAIKELLHSLQFGDKVAVIAFADSPLTIFGADEWAKNSEECFSRLDALQTQQLSVDIGLGTKLAQPLTNAFELIKQGHSEQAVNRIIVISDGIVQDEVNTHAAVETIHTGGVAISTIGVGDDFDEEFLMNVADITRGGYHYAADISTITSELIGELVTIQSTAIRQLYVAAQGISGAVVQDIFLARPNMTIFDEIESADGWIRARVGDIPSDVPTALLVQIAPAKLPDGIQQIVSVELSWQSVDTGGSLTSPQQQSEIASAKYSSDPELLSRRDAGVQELVDRFHVYKYEREAQKARELGDFAKAKDKLGAATRELRKLGEDALAADVDAQIASIGSGNEDPTRVKRIKATTRRLGSKSTSPDTTSA
jgi:Ca-activated chloride channel family protein